MTDYGIKVVNPGKDITSTDIRDLSLSSKYTMLKYFSDTTDSFTITAGGTSGSVSFTHDLGYVPAFIAYVEHSGFESIQRQIPFGRSPQALIENAFATSSVVTCRVNQTAVGDDRTFTFRVIIFKDQIA